MRRKVIFAFERNDTLYRISREYKLVETMKNEANFHEPCTGRLIQPILKLYIEAAIEPEGCLSKMPSRSRQPSYK